VGAWLFGLLFPAYPHAGDPERPVRELFWVGVALAPAIGLALAGIRHGDAAARPAAWCALGLLVVLLLLVAGGLLRVITG
jgi:amino acid transporter